MFHHLEQSLRVWEKWEDDNSRVKTQTQTRLWLSFGSLELQSGTGQSTGWGKNIWCKVNQLKCSVWSQWESEEVRVRAPGDVCVCGGERGCGGHSRSGPEPCGTGAVNRKYGNVTSPPEFLSACNSHWHLLYKQLLTMFGRKPIQQKSWLTLFDICNLLVLDRIVVRHVQDSFVPAPFPPIWTWFWAPFTLLKMKNNTLLCLDFSIHWKLSWELLMQVGLCV